MTGRRTRCRRTLGIASRLVTGETLAARDREHLAGCAACRRAAERGAAFPTLLRTAARSLVAEAANALPGPAPTTLASAAGWHAAVAIDPRAFGLLERRSAPRWLADRWQRAGRPAVAALTVVLVVALGIGIGPRVAELIAGRPAASVPVTASVALTRFLGLGYACRAVQPTGPTPGSGPAYACDRELGGLGSVSLDLHVAPDGSISSIVARLPGSQAVANRSGVQAELRQLVAAPLAGTFDVAAGQAWVDAFFSPATDPGLTAIRLEGLVLHLDVTPSRPYELDVNPAFPG